MDDVIIDGDQSFDILISSAESNDPVYHGMKSNDIRGVRNVDNDHPTISISALEGKHCKSNRED